MQEAALSYLTSIQHKKSARVRRWATADENTGELLCLSMGRNVSTMERFGEKLRVLRERRGLSYRKLAPELGVTYAHIAAIENGAHQPSVDLILRISAYFNISLDQLMRDDRELRLQ